MFGHHNIILYSRSTETIEMYECTTSRTMKHTHHFSDLRNITDLHNFQIKMIRNDPKRMGRNIIQPSTRI